MKQLTPRISLEITPSFYLGCFILFSHLAALATVPVLAIEYPFFLLFVIPVLYSWVRAWRRQQRGFRRLEWNGEGAWKWRLFDVDGRIHHAQLLGNSRVWSGLMVLNFRLRKGGRRSVFLLADNSNAQQCRRLRVRLVTGDW